MDEFLTALVLVLVVACFWALVIGALATFLVLAALGSLILLPYALVGFVRGLRERKAENSNPNV